MDCCCLADVGGFVFVTTFALGLLVLFCIASACALVCAMIGLNGDFACVVCVDTSIFGDTPRLLLLLLLLLICRVLVGTGDAAFGVFAVFNAVIDNLEPVFAERKPNPFGFDTGVGDFVMVV